MWNRIKKPLLALSVGLNVAFIAFWLAQTVPAMISEHEGSENGADKSGIPSFLHREIGVTPDQWSQIEPLLQTFSDKINERRETISGLRSQVMGLLSAPEVDEKAILAKQEEVLAEICGVQELVVGQLLKEKEILTPAQQEAFFEALVRHLESEKGPGGGAIRRLLSDDEPKLPEGEGR